MKWVGILLLLAAGCAGGPKHDYAGSRRYLKTMQTHTQADIETSYTEITDRLDEIENGLVRDSVLNIVKPKVVAYEITRCNMESNDETCKPRVAESILKVIGKRYILSAETANELRLKMVRQDKWVEVEKLALGYHNKAAQAILKELRAHASGQVNQARGELTKTVKHLENDIRLAEEDKRAPMEPEAIESRLSEVGKFYEKLRGEPIKLKWKCPVLGFESVYLDWC